MELEEKFRKEIDILDARNVELDILAKQCIKIAEEFALGFAEFLSTEINGNYYQHSDRNIWHGQYNSDERHYNPLTTQELLELYKQHLKTK